MTDKSLQQKMLDKKNAEKIVDKDEAKLQGLVEKELASKQDEKAAQDVAAAAGATETPAIGGFETGPMTSIVKQTDTPTKEEVQTARTEVDTHVDILPSDPDGANVANPNPPSGTLPNSGMIYNGEEGSVMHNLHASLEAGVAMNQISDEENEKAIKYAEGEARRVRMLEGRPQDGDMRLAQEELKKAPKGGYKSNGITRFVNSQGNWVNAVDGYFVPQNDDEEEILKHYVKTFVVDAPAAK